MRVLQSIEDSALSLKGYVATVEGTADRAIVERDAAREEAARARFVNAQDGTDSDVLYDMAVREYVGRRLGGQGTADRVRNVRFGLGDAWPGTEETPGDDEYAAIRFEWKNPGTGKWEERDISVPERPAALVQECLRIMAELKHG